jgi:signal peptidase I
VSVVLRRARRGPWRAEVAEGSMAPALLPGDWLLLDPTGQRWPRPGSIVVIREPGTGTLAIKRVAARGRRGGAGRDGVGGLGPRDARLLGDAPAVSIDSRTYGPLDADALIARAWFRYGPPGRVGRIR